MLESLREHESPSYSKESKSSRDYVHDHTQTGSDKKNGSLDSDYKYENLKRSERGIVDQLEKAHKFQNERLNQELKSNVFYKRELESLRAELSDTRQKVNSNHFPNNEKDYLLESTKERIRNLQCQREKEVAQGFDYRSTSSPQFHKTNMNREKELQSSNERYDTQDLYSKIEEDFESERLMDSIGTNKTYDLSQSLRASSYEYRDRLSGGLKNLEEKMNQMEKELDDHLIHKNKEYFTNRELVKMKQKEDEKRKNQFDEEMEQADEEEEIMQSLQEKENRTENINTHKTNSQMKFRSAFEKREEKLKRDNEEIGKEIPRIADSYQNLNSPSSKSAEEEEENIKIRVFESEIAILKEENQRIMQDLIEMKRNHEMEKRHGEVKVHPSDLVVKEFNLVAPVSLINKTSIIRQPPKFESDKTLCGMTKEDEIKKTVKNAKKEVQKKLQQKKQELKIINKRQTLIESNRKPEFIGIRNELYKKYYGHPTHLREATYFLNQGIPTSYMSDSKVQVEHQDPKKTLPKRYAKALKY